MVVGAFVGGLSMRDVESLCEEAGLGKLSKSTASRICSELRERFEQFKRRDLYEIKLVALFLDATANALARTRWSSSTSRIGPKDRRLWPDPIGNGRKLRTNRHREPNRWRQRMPCRYGEIRGPGCLDRTQEVGVFKAPSSTLAKTLHVRGLPSFRGSPWIADDRAPFQALVPENHGGDSHGSPWIHGDPGSLGRRAEARVAAPHRGRPGDVARLGACHRRASCPRWSITTAGRPAASVPVRLDERTARRSRRRASSTTLRCTGLWSAATLAMAMQSREVGASPTRSSPL
jgi:mutator family transposase